MGHSDSNQSRLYIDNSNIHNTITTQGDEMDWQQQDARRDARHAEIRSLTDAERKVELTAMLQGTIDNGAGGTIHAIYWKPENRWLRAIVVRPDGKTARYWYNERDCRWQNTGDPATTVSRIRANYDVGWDGSWNTEYWEIVARKADAEIMLARRRDSDIRD